MNVDLEPYIYRPHPIYRLPSREDEGQVEHGDSDSSAEEGPKIILAEG